jgi:hypothetical protein
LLRADARFFDRCAESEPLGHRRPDAERAVDQRGGGGQRAAIEFRLAIGEPRAGLQDRVELRLECERAGVRRLHA